MPRALMNYGFASIIATSSAAQAIPPLEDIVLYEVNLRAMSPAGDLDGVTARITDIKALGANTLWLMPIHPIGEINRVGELGSPYSVRDYGAVGAEYGTMTDLQELVDAAHAMDMYVILDWVANHTAWDHPWVTAHPSWYTQDVTGAIIHPPRTNWLDVADLNYNSIAMRHAMIDAMTAWITDVGIDGFRMDAADFVRFDFWAEAIPAIRSTTSRDLLMLAEGARADHFDAGFDMVFGWRSYGALKSVFGQGASARTIWASQVMEDAAGRTMRFTTNHDESAWDAPPPVLFGGLDGSLAAYATTIMAGGTPLVYSGQETGLATNTPFFERQPIDWSQGADTAAWYAWMLGLRSEHAALRSGTNTDRSTDDVVIQTRSLDDERVLALINVRDTPVSAPVPGSWQGSWHAMDTQGPETLGTTLTLEPYAVRLFERLQWPNFVITGSLQTEAGDPADWDPAASSLIMMRTGSIYTIDISGLASGGAYDLRILSDRAAPPASWSDPTVSDLLRIIGDADGTITVSADDALTNNKGGPVIWIEQDAAPLQVVGDFMDEAGGASDWNPADPMFAMTPLGDGRYVYQTRISQPGTYNFKATYGSGWAHQVGTDGFSDNAVTAVFHTRTPNQPVRLFVDLRARSLFVRGDRLEKTRKATR